jgi:CTP:molybdopterin cytidylyltransferase MocA
MTGFDKIVALIPAAGFSGRMGCFKPLLPLGKSTLIEESVERFRRAGIEDVRVVTGHMAEEMAPILAKLGISNIFNPDYKKGMLSSVLAGLKTFEPEIDAFFLLPADIPMVSPITIETLAGFYRSSGAGIVYPRFEGVRGHPPLISKDLTTDLTGEYDGGLRAFLRRYQDKAVDLDVMDQGVLMDCDTPEDYRSLKAYFKKISE